jgi:uncharacterized protein YodC (DUF2158 family)
MADTPIAAGARKHASLADDPNNPGAVIGRPTPTGGEDEPTGEPSPRTYAPAEHRTPQVPGFPDFTPAKEIAGFSEGQTVQLKCGGPIMVINTPRQAGIECFWFTTSHEKRSENFKPTLLTRVESPVTPPVMPPATTPGQPPIAATGKEKKG